MGYSTDKITFAAIVFVLIFLVPATSASSFPSNETLQQWGEFKSKYGQNWQVKWHKDRDAELIEQKIKPL